MENTCEDRGRGWSDVSTSQGMPRIASKPELEEARKGALPEPPWEQGAEDTLILGFWTPEW